MQLHCKKDVWVCPPPQPILSSAFSLPLSGRKTCLSLNHYPPFYPSVHLIFQSGPSACLSAGTTLCSPFFLAENISMWSWAHLSEPDGCLSNCHSPLPRLHRSRLNTKKGQRTLAWFKAPRMAHTHTFMPPSKGLSCSYYHSMHPHISAIPHHLHTSASLKYHGRYVVWWGMRLKCCSQPSGWPRDLIYA